MVKTSRGSVSVFVCGDQEKPALITYPDVALNCMFFFSFLFLFSGPMASNMNAVYFLIEGCFWVVVCLSFGGNLIALLYVNANVLRKIEFIGDSI